METTIFLLFSTAILTHLKLKHYLKKEAVGLTLILGLNYLKFKCEFSKRPQTHYSGSGKLKGKKGNFLLLLQL